MWKALDALSLWLRGDEGHWALCSFWGTPAEQGGVLSYWGVLVQPAPKLNARKQDPELFSGLPGYRGKGLF